MPNAKPSLSAGDGQLAPNASAPQTWSEWGEQHTEEFLDWADIPSPGQVYTDLGAAAERQLVRVTETVGATTTGLGLGIGAMVVGGVVLIGGLYLAYKLVR